MRVGHGIIKYGLQVISVPATWLLSLLPRNKRLWVFGAWFGQRCSDNPKYLLDFVKQQPGVNPVWITKSLKVKSALMEQGVACEMANSLKGIWLQIRAGVAVINVDLTDISPVWVSGAHILQMWHGTPLKKIGMDNENFHPSGGVVRQILCRVRNYFLKREWSRYHLFAAASEEVGQGLGEAFGLGKGVVYVTGYPRNDAFVRHEEMQSLREKLLKVDLGLPVGTRIIIYMPTHRMEGKGRASFLPFEDLFPFQMNEWLLENDAVLLLKSHFYHSAKSTEQGSLARIVDISQKDYDVQLMLGISDVLVTDLSSAYFDFLLLDRPIVFVDSEIDEYISNERGLYYDYWDVTPGAKVHTQKAFLDTLGDYLQNPTRDSNERRRISKRFNEVESGEACARVFGVVRELLGMGW